VAQTLEALARIRGISPSQAAETTTGNAFRLFKLDLAQPVG
jgi:Tat protein secretion system quality control protein TatD with DNase activity